jgi:hypothetical protein
MAITISLAISGLYAVPEVLVLNELRLCHDKLKETIPSLGEVGGHQLYPQDAAAGMKILAIFRSVWNLHILRQTDVLHYCIF